MSTHSITDDRAAFAAHVERHRHELRVHCYRMLGSFDEAEDLTQETFLRAWRGRAGYAGRSTVRAWLYRIATNACVDALERRPRRPAGEEVPWLQPYPEALLEQLPSDDAQPDAALVAKETIELAFVVAIQHLPPRPRAVLILRDVLGWRAKETAELLGMSVAAVNSALQRARAALQQHLPERRLEWPGGEDPTAAERALVRRYVEATERGNAQAIAATLREDARFSMPPEPGLYDGRKTIVDAWEAGGFGSDAFGRIRCIETRANRQPAVACYVRHDDDTAYRALGVDVLRIEGGAIAEVTAFGPDRFEVLGLPEAL